MNKVQILAGVSEVVKGYWYLPEAVFNGADQGWLHVYAPVAGVVAYLLGKPMLVQLCKLLNTTGKSYPFFLLMVLHNLFLALFSAVVWYESWAVVKQAVESVGLMPAYCDSVQNGGAMWKAGMGRLAFLFYLSKYYEFVDTIILVVKRKPVSVLQTYHHAGAVLTMFGLVYTQATATLWFVCLNSMIHTFMYTYYLLSACGIRLPGKSLITTAQIIQFFAGILCTVPMFVMRGECQTDMQLLALGAVHAYVLPLIGLFTNFYIKSYTSTGSKGKKKKNM